MTCATIINVTSKLAAMTIMAMPNNADRRTKHAARSDQLCDTRARQDQGGNHQRIGHDGCADASSPLCRRLPAMASIDTCKVETLKISMICASTITIIGVHEADACPVRYGGVDLVGAG